MTNTMKHDKRLLPCPFCGGPAYWFNDDGQYIPGCNMRGCWCILGAYNTEEEAILAWNSRKRTDKP